MRTRFFTISIFLASFSCLMATPDSIYHKGNKLYQESRYEEAIDEYQLAIVAGYGSSSLFYNMGNAYFRSNKLGKARLYYEKALKMNPDDEDVSANILYLEGMLADRFEEVPVVFYKKWIKNIVLSLSSDQWAYLSVLSFICLVLSVLAYLMFRKRIIRKTGFYLSLVFLFISVAGFAASWKQYLRIRNPDTAIVTELSVNVRSAPHESGTGLFILHEGAKVILEDKTDGWQEIRLSDGRKGWLPAQSIEAI